MADAKRSFSWGQTTQRQKEKGTYWSGLSRKWPPFSGNESLIRKLSRNNLPVNPHFPFLFNSFSCGLTSAVRPHHSQATKKRKEKKRRNRELFGGGCEWPLSTDNPQGGAIHMLSPPNVRHKFLGFALNFLLLSHQFWAVLSSFL